MKNKNIFKALALLGLVSASTAQAFDINKVSTNMYLTGVYAPSYASALLAHSELLPVQAADKTKKLINTAIDSKLKHGFGGGIDFNYFWLEGFNLGLGLGYQSAKQEYTTTVDKSSASSTLTSYLGYGRIEALLGHYQLADKTKLVYYVDAALGMSSNTIKFISSEADKSTKSEKKKYAFYGSAAFNVSYSKFFIGAFAQYNLSTMSYGLKLGFNY